MSMNNLKLNNKKITSRFPKLYRMELEVSIRHLIDRLRMEWNIGLPENLCPYCNTPIGKILKR